MGRSKRSSALSVRCGRLAVLLSRGFALCCRVVCLRCCACGGDGFERIRVLEREASVTSRSVKVCTVLDALLLPLDPSLSWPLRAAASSASAARSAALYARQTVNTTGVHHSPHALKHFLKEPRALGGWDSIGLRHV